VVASGGPLVEIADVVQKRLENLRSVS